MALKEAQDVLELDTGAALPLGTRSGNSRKLDPGLPTSGLRKERSNSQTSELFNEVFSSIITLVDLVAQDSEVLCPRDRKHLHTAQLTAKLHTLNFSLLGCPQPGSTGVSSMAGIHPRLPAKGCDLPLAAAVLTWCDVKGNTLPEALRGSGPNAK